MKRGEGKQFSLLPILPWLTEAEAEACDDPEVCILNSFLVAGATSGAEVRASDLLEEVAVPLPAWCRSWNYYIELNSLLMTRVLPRSCRPWYQITV